MIRKATLDDVQSIIKEGEKFLQYHPSTFIFNEEHITNLVIELINNHIVLVLYIDNSFSGMIGGMSTPHMYDPTHIMLVELFWWVTEDARGSLKSYKLFKEFEKIGKELNVTSIVMTSTNRTPALEKIYKKNNYILYESSYVREL